MKPFKLRLPVMALAITVLSLLSAPAAVFAQVATPSAAQTPSSCSLNTVAQAIDPSVSASGYPDEGFDYTPPAPAADPKPENPVTKSCEDGKIQIMVGNKQQFGNRIGGIVEVRILLLVQDGVDIDFSSLQRGILNFDGTDRFHLAKDNPVAVSLEKKAGKTLYTIDLRVQTFVPKPSVVFNIDLRYSTSLVAATQKPDWKVLTTPNFMVTTSNTLDNGEDLNEGNMQPAVVALPWATRTLLYTGAGLVLLWPLMSLIIWLLRKRPGRKIPPHEVAWATFTKVFKSGEAEGYRESHFRNLVDALKGYLDAGTRTREEVSEMLKDSPKHDLIISALKKCDTALYVAKHNGTGGNLLTDLEIAELVAQIKEIVPQPE
ncbi:hypothetical protein BH10CYA1_BH10CYA1_29030 [soil metagenome]